MASIQINSPADGATLPADKDFDVSVSWDAGAGFAPTYRVTCTGATTLTDQAASGSHTFTVKGGPSGTNMIVTASLQSDDGTTLASDTIGVSFT